MHPANPAAALDHGKSSPGRLAPLRVYLVEDSALLCERMVELLTDPGRIEFAGQAETEGAAVAGISECRPDAVIVDIRLRERTGVHVLRYVAHKNRTGGHPQVNVVTN